MKRCIFAGITGLVLILGIVLISCREGLYEGLSSNFIIIGLEPYNNKYVEVELTTNDSQTLHFEKRIKISKGEASAPLRKEDGEWFRGAADCKAGDLIITIYNSNKTTDADVQKTITSDKDVKIWDGGSAVFDINDRY